MEPTAVAPCITFSEVFMVLVIRAVPQLCVLRERDFVAVIHTLVPSQHGLLLALGLVVLHEPVRRRPHAQAVFAAHGRLVRLAVRFVFALVIFSDG